MIGTSIVRVAFWIALFGVCLASFVSRSSAGQALIEDTGSEIVIRTPPVDLPVHVAGDGHSHDGVFPPVVELEVPVSAYIYGFRYHVVNGSGEEVPRSTLHHFSIVDPEYRELFVPISRRLLAAGQETGEQRVPWLLLGTPVKKGQQVVVTAMLHNPTPISHSGVSLVIEMPYVAEGRPWPLFDVHAFQVDVAFPAGDKSFDLPPGKFSKSWEGQPAIPGRIVGLGGHLHEHATHLTFEDITEGRVLWTAYPEFADDGSVRSVSSKKMIASLGLRIRPDHTYRVTAHYINSTGTVIENGGMGLVGGVFVPDDSVTWPRADTTNPLYLVDRLHYLRRVRGPYTSIVAQREQQDNQQTSPGAHETKRHEPVSSPHEH